MARLRSSIFNSVPGVFTANPFVLLSKNEKLSPKLV